MDQQGGYQPPGGVLHNTDLVTVLKESEAQRPASVMVLASHRRSPVLEDRFVLVFSRAFWSLLKSSEN